MVSYKASTSERSLSYRRNTLIVVHRRLRQEVTEHLSEQGWTQGRRGKEKRKKEKRREKEGEWRSQLQCILAA